MDVIVTTLIFLVPVLYAGIQTLELSAVFAREAGVRSNNPMLGFSVQQSVYMGTRLILVIMLPILGFLIDSGIDAGTFSLMSHASLLLAAIFGLFLLHIREKLLNYYMSVIYSYKKRNVLLSSLLNPFPFIVSDSYSPKSLTKIFEDHEARVLFFQALLVFSIYTSGLFISFYCASIFPEYRATLSQASGIFNALGAFLLTFIIEPKISMRIDLSAKNASDLIFALFMGRLIAVLVVGQLFLFLIFGMVSG